MNRLLIEDAYSDAFARRRGGTRYSIRKIPDLDVGLRKESQARKIGRCLGRVVGDKHTLGLRPLNNDTDLVLLSTCAEAEHQIRALSGELSIIVERWGPTMKLVRETAREGNYAAASEAILEANSLFTAINSGAMKYRWFVDQRLSGVIVDVAKFSDTQDPSGDLRDDWNLLWPESTTPNPTNTPEIVWANITAMGQWLVTASVAIRVFNYWLVLNADARGQEAPRKASGALDDCLKWCGHFSVYCSKFQATPFGEMVSQLIRASGKQEIQVVGEQCKLAAAFINDAGRRAIRHLLSDSTLLCETYGTTGEFRPFPYAVFFDVEETRSPADPYAKQLKLASDLIDEDMRLVENSHNPWKKGLWILLRGNRSSTKAVGLCQKLMHRCKSSGLRFRAVVLGQLAYDDSIRDMAGSVKLAEGDFFRRVANLRPHVLPMGYSNHVTFVNEETDGSISEGQKYRKMLNGIEGTVQQVVSGNEELPEKRFLVTKVNTGTGEGRAGRGHRSNDVDQMEGFELDLRANELRGSVDVGIITIREDEFEAVLRRFSSRQHVKGSGSDYEFAEASTTAGGKLRIVIARSAEQGQSAAQALASTMISDLAPKWIFVVGIAGAFPASEYTLGDVLLSQRMHDFAVSAAVEGKPPSFQDMGGPMAVEVEKLVTGLKGRRQQLGLWNEEKNVGLAKPNITLPADISSNELYGNDEWKAKVLATLTHHFPSDTNVNPPDFFAAVIIASNTLVKDTGLASQWQLNARHASGVEMELGGVCKAARYATPAPNVLAIRALSDIVGYKRSHEWTDYACRSAAAFAAALIESGLIQPSALHNPE